MKKKYFIREKSLAWYFLKARDKVKEYKESIIPIVLALSLVCGMALATELYQAYGLQHKPDIVRETPEPTGETYKVVAYYDGDDLFVTEDGECFSVTETNYAVDDCVILTLNDNATENVTDDSVTEIKDKPQTYDVPLSTDLQEYIIECCEQYPSEINQVSLELILAVIERESNFNPDAIGDNGNALGLMQIQPRWHQARMERLGVTDLLDPYQNVRVGIDYLAECLKGYETLDEALTVYNAGPSGAYTLYFSKGILASPYANDVLDNWHEICQSILK